MAGLALIGHRWKTSERNSIRSTKPASLFTCSLDAPPLLDPYEEGRDRYINNPNLIRQALTSMCLFSSLALSPSSVRHFKGRSRNLATPSSTRGVRTPACFIMYGRLSGEVEKSKSPSEPLRNVERPCSSVRTTLCDNYHRKPGIFEAK